MLKLISEIASFIDLRQPEVLNKIYYPTNSPKVVAVRIIFLTKSIASTSTTRQMKQGWYLHVATKVVSLLKILQRVLDNKQHWYLVFRLTVIHFWHVI